jgi:S-adenosylmethionine:tRNA ribosyltransferase-isomerase
MRTELFDFDLPEDRIALRPAEPRDAARLLVVDGARAPAPQDTLAVLLDKAVRDLPELLAPGDALVLNDTRVIPAALDGVRMRSGIASHVSFNLLRRVDDCRWRALARPAKRLQIGDRVRFGAEGDTACLMSALGATVCDKLDAGEVELMFDLAGPDLDIAIQGVGSMPLPPYIAGRRAPDAGDRASYQTIYAKHDGAVAAPTAGLHFTPELFAALAARGVSRHHVTLHVGAGTFLPVKADDTRDHKMHSEYGEVSAETAEALNAVRARGGRIVAAGTTSLRILESASREDGKVEAFAGETDIFITPGYRFRTVDVLLTNFHLPRSTLFMLVSAFAGLDTMKQAYAHAIGSGYRFYSYGDASLLFRVAADAASRQGPA